MKKIAEGAEAKIYAGTIYGMEIVAKSRKPKDYRIKKLDNRIRRQRTKKEAKLMKRASDGGINAPRLISVTSTTIFMEKIDGKLLKDIPIKKQHAHSLGALLVKLHGLGIVHGDFTPANIICFGPKIYLIDFGLSESSTSSEEKALDILLMKRQLPKKLYPNFIKAYCVSKSSKEILARLAQIEERGRYQSRTLT